MGGGSDVWHGISELGLNKSGLEVQGQVRTPWTIAYVSV